MQHLGELAARVRTGTWLGRLIELPACGGVSDRCLADDIDDITALLECVRKGDRVIQRLDNSILSVGALLALWERGAVPIPIKTSSDNQTVERLAADCNARFVLSPPSRKLEQLTGYCDETTVVARCRQPRVTGSDLALIIYTSGSTGTPKGIMLSHTNVLAALFSIKTYLGLDRSDVILNLLPLTFDYGLYQVLFSLTFDLTTVLYNEYVQPFAILRALQRHEVSVLPVVPPLASAIERVLRTHRMNIPTLRKLTNTGGHLSAGTIKGLRDTLPQTRIYAMYGLTECKRALYLPPEDLDRKIGSVGVPMPGMDAVVVRLEHRDSADGGGKRLVEAGPNEVGELFVRGASVMQGYTRADSDAGARLIGGAYRDDIWLGTGDLFSCDEDGYFYFRGRIKDLVKQGGYCIYPLELEEALMRHPKVEGAAVIGTIDSNGLEVARAYIKLSEYETPTRAEVLNWINDHMEVEYRPRDIRFLVNIPTNNNGKIDKARLAQDASSE